MSNNISRIGERFKHPIYGIFEITGYRSCEDVDITFLNTGYSYTSTYSHIINLEVQDRLFKWKYGNFNGGAERNADSYKRWYNMLYRCHNCKGYRNVSICDDWYNFSEFLKWDIVQYKEDGWHLDKDILSKGKSVYSPSSCCYLPPELNTFFEKYKKAKGYSYNKRREKFEAYCRDNGKYIHLGLFDTEGEARLAYLKRKREVFAKLIDRYKDKISESLIKAMNDYLC